MMRTLLKMSIFVAESHCKRKEIIMNASLLIFGLGGPEVIVILLIVLLLFGGKKVPELMKGLGKGVGSFKEGMNEVKSEMDKADEEAGQK